MVDSSGLENRYSSKQRTIEGSNPSLSLWSANGFFLLVGPKKPSQPIKYFFNMTCPTQPNMYYEIKVILTPSQALDHMSQFRGVMERTGSKSRSIPFSNPAAAARARPACHKCPTNKKNPRTK